MYYQGPCAYKIMKEKRMPKEADELLTKGVPLKCPPVSPVQLTTVVKHPHSSPCMGPWLDGTFWLFHVYSAVKWHADRLTSLAEMQDFIKWIVVLSENCLTHSWAGLVTIANKISASNENDLTIRGLRKARGKLVNPFACFSRSPSLCAGKPRHGVWKVSVPLPHSSSENLFPGQKPGLALHLVRSRDQTSS